MSTDTDHLVLEHLRAIRTGVDRLQEDMREVKQRLEHLEEQVRLAQPPARPQG